MHSFDDTLCSHCSFQTSYFPPDGLPCDNGAAVRLVVRKMAPASVPLPAGNDPGAQDSPSAVRAGLAVQEFEVAITSESFSKYLGFKVCHSSFSSVRIPPGKKVSIMQKPRPGNVLSTSCNVCLTPLESPNTLTNSSGRPTARGHRP